MQGLQFLSLSAKDIEPLSRPMSRAFRSNHHDSPVNIGQDLLRCSDCITVLSASLADPLCLCFKVCFGSETIGAFVIHWNEFGDSDLRHLFLEPKFQNRGIGRRVWEFLQSCYPTQSWRVETPSNIERNLHFYRHVCGFELVSERNGVTTLCWRGEPLKTKTTINDCEYEPAE